MGQPSLKLNAASVRQVALLLLVVLLVFGSYWFLTHYGPRGLSVKKEQTPLILTAPDGSKIPGPIKPPPGI